MKRISEPSQLPEWFDINNYHVWEDENPVEACRSIQTRFCIIYQLDHARILNNNKSPLFENGIFYLILDMFGFDWKKPFNNFVFTMLLKKIKEEMDRAGILEYPLDEKENIGIGHIASKINGELAWGYHGQALKAITLYDIIHYADKYKLLKHEIDKKAELISKDNGVDEEKLKEELYKQFLIRDGDGWPIYKLPPELSITVKSAIEEVEQYFLEQENLLGVVNKAKESDVIKLFNYNIAAYCDLTIWALIEGCSITQQCMAQALFSDGRFEKHDLTPSRTIGGFIRRLRQGYIHELVNKSYELETLQKP